MKRSREIVDGHQSPRECICLYAFIHEYGHNIARYPNMHQMGTLLIVIVYTKVIYDDFIYIYLAKLDISPCNGTLYSPSPFLSIC